ncbi:MAG TPA: metallophosphoesterase, partial [Candidatus Obscuribacter sp.]|nr:metallophosphoesterase [Candidatus Obscuribacter sp.]
MKTNLSVRPSRRTSTARSLDRMIKKLGAKKGIDVSEARAQLRDKLKELNAKRALGYLAYHGIIDLNLPDGTTVAILPDWHIPAHDKQVSWMVKEWLRDNQPDILIIIGDAVDMFGLSRWPKAPGVIANTQHEYDEVRRMLDEVIRLSGALHVFYILGNHEEKHLQQRHSKPEKLSPSHLFTRNALEPKHYEYLAKLPLFIRLPEFGAAVVHAGVFPGVPLEAQKPNHLLHIQHINPPS